MIIETLILQLVQRVIQADGIAALLGVLVVPLGSPRLLRIIKGLQRKLLHLDFATLCPGFNLAGDAALSSLVTDFGKRLIGFFAIAFQFLFDTDELHGGLHELHAVNSQTRVYLFRIQTVVGVRHQQVLKVQDGHPVLAFADLAS